MTSGVPVVFNRDRVIENFQSGMTCTRIAEIERCHRSCITKFLKKNGFDVLPSRLTGPSKGFNREKRIASARSKIEKARRILEMLGAKG